MHQNKFIRISVYILTAAVALVSIYVFLSGGQLIAKLDALY